MLTHIHLRLGLAGLVLVLGAACRGGATLTLTPEIEGPPGDFTPGAQAGVTGVYYGLFDCTGAEAGLLAYAGRLGFEQGGAVTFVDYDGGEHAGTYTYDASDQTYTFSSGFVISDAEYDADDTVRAEPAEGAGLPHTEGDEINCVRAEPGVTGPP